MDFITVVDVTRPVGGGRYKCLYDNYDVVRSLTSVRQRKGEELFVHQAPPPTAVIQSKPSNRSSGCLHMLKRHAQGLMNDEGF